MDDNMEATPSDRAALLITAASASFAFTIGFNLGAFGVIFFDQLLAVWVISTVVFAGSLVGSLPPRTWPRRLILLLPTLWIVAAWVDNTFGLTTGDRVAFTLTVAVTIIALPFVAWILITVINADFANLPRGRKGVVMAAVGLFMIIGFVIGARNDMFLNCGDFTISGNDLPANCLEVTP
jgi:hypothetical protein